MRAHRTLHRSLLLAVAWLFCAEAALARVLSLDVTRREPLLEGKAFGDRGAYELIEGRIHFGFDPESEANARVSDLGLGPRDAEGWVRASADLVVLQALDPAKRRGTALIDVPNRGRRLALGMLNRAGRGFGASAELDPADPSHWGDGFAMEQGITLIWVGWQADAPDFPGAMRLRVPKAEGADGKPVRGLARSDWVVDAPAASLPLAAMGHRPHLPSDRGASENTLTRRMTRNGKRQPIARDQWRFSEDGSAIELDGGFAPGVYELVYVSEAPPLVGLGFAGYRDVASFAKHDPRSPFPVERAVATGSSQSGRFLRHFLYEGFNRDGLGRQVYDGVIVNIAGGGRGGFNHRFGQPGRAPNPFQYFFYPGDMYPFTSRPVEEAGQKKGLLDRAVASKTAPKLFQINTGYEYWGRAASLVQMTPDGSADVAPLDDERLYHIASAPHFPMAFPPDPKTRNEHGIYRGSAIDTSYPARALTLRMLEWVERGHAPPPSRIPSLQGGTLVPSETLHYPLALHVPRTPHVADRLDFGARFEAGIVDHQPPHRAGAYAIRVPAIDALGNERSGIRLLEVEVPIGTYLPWATRAGYAFAEDEMPPFFGTFAPLSVAEEQRVRRGDRRPLLGGLYASQAVYIERVNQAIDALVRDGFMLERDREHAREAAMARWDWMDQQASQEQTRPDAP